MIALIDYGVGNLRSVEKALQTVGASVRLTSAPDEIRAADKVVLPGVGAFGDGMAGLRARGLPDVVREIAAAGTPLLGICLGMQLLFEQSEELGRHSGLGLLPGYVRLFDSRQVKVPHTGWNQLWPARQSTLLHGVEPGAYTYFNHGLYCVAEEEHILAQTDYAIRYASVVGRGNLYGVQFHPEKSQRFGLTILRNFVERC